MSYFLEDILWESLQFSLCQQCKKSMCKVLSKIEFVKNRSQLTLIILSLFATIQIMVPNGKTWYIY